jgi:hypothetical protein
VFSSLLKVGLTVRIRFPPAVSLRTVSPFSGIHPRDGAASRRDERAALATLLRFAAVSMRAPSISNRSAGSSRIARNSEQNGPTS